MNLGFPIGSPQPFVSTPRSSIHKGICDRDRTMTKFFKKSEEFSLRDAFVAFFFNKIDFPVIIRVFKQKIDHSIAELIVERIGRIIIPLTVPASG